MKEIYRGGGIKVNIDLEDGKGKRNSKFLPVIQLIVGDCKENELLCDQKGTHSLDTPWLCRNYDIPSQKYDDCKHPCKFTTKDDIEGKSVKDLGDMSRYKIRNGFHDLPFRGC